MMGIGERSARHREGSRGTVGWRSPIYVPAEEVVFHEHVLHAFLQRFLLLLLQGGTETWVSAPHPDKQGRIQTSRARAAEAHSIQQSCLHFPLPPLPRPSKLKQGEALWFGEQGGREGLPLPSAPAVWAVPCHLLLGTAKESSSIYSWLQDGLEHQIVRRGAKRSPRLKRGAMLPTHLPLYWQLPVLRQAEGKFAEHSEMEESGSNEHTQSCCPSYTIAPQLALENCSIL